MPQTSTILDRRSCFLLSIRGSTPVSILHPTDRNLPVNRLILHLNFSLKINHFKFRSIRVEPTNVPAPGFKTNNYRHPQLNNLKPSSSLQSSFFLPEINNDYDDYDYDRRVYLPHSPLFIRRVWDYVSNDMYRWFGTSTTKRTKSTVYFTRTKTITENEMTTKTNTIAITGCTPSPLPYDLCVP